MKKLLAIIMILAMTTGFTYEGYDIYERNGEWFASTGQHNTSEYSKYIDFDSVGRIGNFNIELVNDTWVVHNGVDIFSADVEVVTLWNSETETYMNFLHMDDWAYLRMFYLLPIRITYDYQKYVKTGELSLRTWDDSNYRVIYSKADHELGVR